MRLLVPLSDYRSVLPATYIWFEKSGDVRAPVCTRARRAATVFVAVVYENVAISAFRPFDFAISIVPVREYSGVLLEYPGSTLEYPFSTLGTIEYPSGLSTSPSPSCRSVSTLGALRSTLEYV